MQDTERIKEKIAIDELVGQYVDLKPAGRSLTARCPFHEEKTPSFYVTPDRGIYKCFGCGKGGDIFSFIQDIEGIGFREALELLAEKAGIELSKKIQPKNPAEKDQKERLYNLMDIACKWFQVQFRKTPNAIEYVKKRGVKKQTMIDFAIGYAPHEWGALANVLKQKGFTDEELITSGMGIKGKSGVYDRFRARIVVPIFDQQGRVIAFSARTDPTKQSIHTEKAAKYINSPESPLFDKSKALLGIHVAKSWWGKRKRAVIVEGAFDVILAHQAGTYETVAVSGTALTPQHIKQIKRLAPVIYTVFDGDAAGHRATNRSTAHALEQGIDVKVVTLPEGSDPADVISSDPLQWNGALNHAKPFFEALLKRLESEGVFQNTNGAHEVLSVVRQNVYPLIRYVQDPVAQARTLGVVADLLGVSQKVVEDDFQSTNKVQAIQNAEDQSIEEKVEQSGVSTKPQISKKQSLIGALSLLCEFLKEDKVLSEEEQEAIKILTQQLQGYPFYTQSITKTIAKHSPQKCAEYEMLVSAKHGLESINPTTQYIIGLLQSFEKEAIQNHIQTIERSIRIHQKAHLIPKLHGLKKQLETL